MNNEYNISDQSKPYVDCLTSDEEKGLHFLKVLHRRNEKQLAEMECEQIADRMQDVGIELGEEEVAYLFNTRRWAVFTDTLEEWITDADEDRPRW